MSHDRHGFCGYDHRGVHESSKKQNSWPSKQQSTAVAAVRMNRPDPLGPGNIFYRDMECRTRIWRTYQPPLRAMESEAKARSVRDRRARSIRSNRPEDRRGLRRTAGLPLHSRSAARRHHPRLRPHGRGRARPTRRACRDARRVIEPIGLLPAPFVLDPKGRGFGGDEQIEPPLPSLASFGRLGTAGSVGLRCVRPKLAPFVSARSFGRATGWNCGARPSTEVDSMCATGSKPSVKTARGRAISGLGSDNSIGPVRCLGKPGPVAGNAAHGVPSSTFSTNNCPVTPYSTRPLKTTSAPPRLTPRRSCSSWHNTVTLVTLLLKYPET
ncbi:hypothetical protein SAMN05421783_1417 [Thiocapsa roseopersicina]|uniref:Uncharacterized protein n=1 Tax=Thiocapsa roseopersicina TaxID=1058 RepID=A0A1H3D247_THIRO|nr:hypothetical protein SAMN05421783_1417 [Thiocapsa roseopersicina]